jgi:2-keto-4-pentenoate hydratase
MSFKGRKSRAFMADLGTIESISTAFVDARRDGQVLDAFPGIPPDDLDTAYRIQDRAIARAASAIGGWKVGRINPGLVDRFGAERIAGPIFAERIVHATTDAVVEMPVLAGFAAVEAEILLQVGATPPADLTPAGAADFVAAVRLGIEIASSPFPGINEYGPAVTASDFGNNFGLVVGPEIVDWRSLDLNEASARVTIDTVVEGVGGLADMLDGPFGSLVFLNALLHRRGLALKSGDWVSTGAITGVHQVTAGRRVLVTFADRYSVSCNTVAFAGTGPKVAVR